ncbi:hypothetical protein ACQ3I4_11580 [Zafaria sp. Z1313]|uniref:hypothetical protein n=1 Tax=Zafaria sp. Z1313 TaxID=3423202 RepID=UPI003D301B40
MPSVTTEPVWICHRCSRRAYSGRVYTNLKQALNGQARWTVAHWQCDRDEHGRIAWDANYYYLDIRNDLTTSAQLADTDRHVRMKRWARSTNWAATIHAALNR